MTTLGQLDKKFQKIKGDPREGFFADTFVRQIPACVEYIRSFARHPDNITMHLWRGFVVAQGDRWIRMVPAGDVVSNDVYLLDSQGQKVSKVVRAFAPATNWMARPSKLQGSFSLRPFLQGCRLLGVRGRTRFSCTLDGVWAHFDVEGCQESWTKECGKSSFPYNVTVCPIDVKAAFKGIRGGMASVYRVEGYAMFEIHGGEVIMVPRVKEAL